MTMKKTFFVLGILFVVFFVAGYYYINSNSNEGVTAYSFIGPAGTYEFLKSEQGDHWLSWSMRSKYSDKVNLVQDYKTPFAYGPQDLLDIPMKDSRAILTSAKQVYITRDANLDDLYQDVHPKGGMVISLHTIGRTLSKFQINSTFAAIEDSAAARERELPIITCENATRENIVIFFKEGDHNEIYRSEDNRYCIVAEFLAGDDPNKDATKIVYNIIGVM